MLAYVLVIHFGCADVSPSGVPPYINPASMHTAILMDALNTVRILEDAIQTLKTYARMFPEKAGVAEEIIGIGADERDRALRACYRSAYGLLGWYRFHIWRAWSRHCP